MHKSGIYVYVQLPVTSIASLYIQQPTQRLVPNLHSTKL